MIRFSNFDSINEIHGKLEGKRCMSIAINDKNKDRNLQKLNGCRNFVFFSFSNQMPHSESWVFFANTTLKSAELHNRSQAIIRQVYVHCWHARIQTKIYKIKEYAAGRRRRLTTTTANEEEEKFLFQLKRKWLCGMNDGNRNSHGK